MVASSRLVFPVMGTVSSIVVAPRDAARLGDQAIADAMDAARAELESLDHRFSHYAPDSQISSWLAGGAVSPDTVAEFTFVLRQCGRLRDESGGVFTIRNPATGTIDTAGYVKGYAIGRAAETMLARDLANFIVTVGGDTFCAGRAADERPWRVAIADPLRRRGISAIVEATDLAVATSGTIERGSHIWNVGSPARAELLSFTVIGPDVAEADAYATVAFAMGEAGLAWVAGHDGYRSFAIRPDGSVLGDAALVSAA